MKITICASITLTPKIKEVAADLTAMGHKINIPTTTQRIIDGEFTFEEYLREKEKNGDGRFRANYGEDLIKKYFNYIKESDAILVLNLDKNGVRNYIGGSVLMEIGFAHVLDKKIYFYNALPEMAYTDELKAVKPVIISGDLKKIV